MRDYVKWHERYADPNSSISARLRKIQDLLNAELDARPGPLRLFSLCAGDARDILGVLEQRPADAPRVSGTLIEINPDLTRAARERIARLGSPLEMLEMDATDPNAAAAHIPADIVILAGIFSNIAETDNEPFAAAATSFCAPGALLIWTRRNDDHDMILRIQGRFAAAGFTDQHFSAVGKGVFGYGSARAPNQPPPPLPTDRKLFTFVL